MDPRFTVTSGSNLRCRGWRQEGLLRLLENVLAVGEDPSNLVVYAALGKAARDWPSHDKIVETLRTMSDGETLVVQSGKPIGLLKTHEKAPIVIMANCNMVGQWAKAENFYELQKRNLICWGGLTAGDWQYIGSQGVIQGTYEIFMRIAERHFDNNLEGRSDPDRRTWRHGRFATARWTHGWRDHSLRRDRRRAHRKTPGQRLISIIVPAISTTRWRWSKRRRREGRATSIGLAGNAADVCEALLARRHHPRRCHGPDVGTRSCCTAISLQDEASPKSGECASTIRTP